MSDGAPSDESTPTPDAGTQSWPQRIDDGVYRVECALVTLAGVLMTATVSLDILHRAFISEESKLAEKLLALFGLVGVSNDEGNYAFFRDYIAPFCLCLVTFLGGWAISAAGRRYHKRPRSTRSGVIYGVAAIVLGYALVTFVKTASSNTVCTTLLLMGCVAWFINGVRRKARLDATLAVITGGLGAYVCQFLPQDYIWSQELSLILLAWVAFIGGSMATRAGRHIQVDALSRVLPKKLQPWSRAMGLTITCLFTAYLTYLAYEHVFGPMGDYNSGELRPATRMPAWTIILSAVVAFGLMTIRFGAKAYDAFRNPKTAERELVH